MRQIDEDLPDDLQEEIEGEQEATEVQIAKLNGLIAEKRDAAMAARKQSGLEEIWMICEEAYVGIDDANRGEFANAKWAKPTSVEGPVTTEYTRTDKTRSNAYVRLTSRYVDAGASKVAEILLPIDDKPFSISPTPVPDLVKGKDDMRGVMDANGLHMYRDQTPEELAELAMKEHITLQQQAAQAGQIGLLGSINLGQPMLPPPAATGGAQTPAAAAPAMAQPQPGQPPAPGGAQAPVPTASGKVQMTVADFAKVKLEAAEDAADKAETRIWEWLVESNYPGETRKVLFDSARIGVGILKGPSPEIKKSQAVTHDEDGGGVTMEIVEKVVPAVKWVDPWNFFPADDCGENIHNGDYVLERDYLSPKMLKALRKQKGYISDQIDIVLKEGPGKLHEEGSKPDEKKNKNRFEVWYWYGTLSMDDMAVLNEEAISDLPADQDDVYAIVTMVNDRIIRATLNPMDSGRFPYDAFPWSRRPSSWAGVGVAEQVSMPQRMVNAATRAMLNNAGISAGAQVVIDRLSLVPADGQWAITPNKIWYNSDDMPIEDVNKLFAMIEFPNVGKQLMDVINYAFKLAEEQSNIPLIAQGQIADKMPDTFGAAELLNTNANTLLRAIGYSYDDYITEPKINAFYEWLLLDPEVPDDEKGSFKINAHGSTALVERAIQEQSFATILQLSLQPAYKIDPALAICEWLKSKRIDPRKVQYSEQELEKMESAPPTPPLPLQVAQLKAQSDQTIAQSKAQSDAQLQQARSQQELQMLQAQSQQEQQSLQNGQSSPHLVAAQAKIQEAQIRAQSEQAIESSRAQAELQYAQTEQEVAQQNAQARIQEMQLQRELEMLKYANQNKLSLDDMKMQLAKTSMIEDTKKHLALTDAVAKSTESQLDRQHDMTKHVSTLLTQPTNPI